jgi:hypothetical protein
MFKLSKPLNRAKAKSLACVDLQAQRIKENNLNMNLTPFFEKSHCQKVGIHNLMRIFS